MVPYNPAVENRLAEEVPGKEEHKIYNHNIDIRYIEQMSGTKATILVGDRKESLVMELRDDSKTSCRGADTTQRTRCSIPASRSGSGSIRRAPSSDGTGQRNAGKRLGGRFECIATTIQPKGARRRSQQENEKKNEGHEGAFRSK